MKIVIDGRFWGPGHTGLGVYTQNLVENLTKVNKKNQYVILQPQNVAPYTFKEQLLMPFFLYKELPDLVHFPSINIPIFYFGKYIITVHDLIKHESRGADTTTHHRLVYWPKYAIYLFVVWWAVHFAVKILVPSNDVKKRLIAKYHLPPQKIVVTYEGAVLSPDKSSPTDLPEKFAIFAGNAYPHKNLARLISAWQRVYKATRVKLIISSGRSVFSKKIEDLIKNKPDVIYKGYLSDQELSFTYAKALVYVFPTLAEGFGIPGLDAMRFNLPVVCSNLPVLQEIYGPAAFYFDPKDESDMAEKIIRVLTDQDLRNKFVKLGKHQVAKYSWVKTARQTLKVYESCSGLRSDQ